MLHSKHENNTFKLRNICNIRIKIKELHFASHIAKRMEMLATPFSSDIKKASLPAHQETAFWETLDGTQDDRLLLEMLNKPRQLHQRDDALIMRCLIKLHYELEPAARESIGAIFPHNKLVARPQTH